MGAILGTRAWCPTILMPTHMCHHTLLRRSGRLDIERCSVSADVPHLLSPWPGSFKEGFGRRAVQRVGPVAQPTDWCATQTLKRALKQWHSSLTCVRHSDKNSSCRLNVSHLTCLCHSSADEEVIEGEECAHTHTNDATYLTPFLLSMDG